MYYSASYKLMLASYVFFLHSFIFVANITYGATETTSDSLKTDVKTIISDISRTKAQIAKLWLKSTGKSLLNNTAYLAYLAQ